MMHECKLKISQLATSITLPLQVMVAAVRCEEIANENYVAFAQNKVPVFHIFSTSSMFFKCSGMALNCFSIITGVE